MQTHLEQDLEDLKRNLFKMADMVSEAITLSVDALKKCDVEAAKKVTKNDTLIDKMEMQIDDQCIMTLITQQPAASDMRFILAILKINTDLERIADLASTVAKQTKKLCGEELVNPVINIPRMAEISVKMLHEVLESISSRSAEKAYKVLEMDHELDSFDEQIHADLYTIMTEHPKTIHQSLAIMKVAKSLERIGDHIKNIAERAVYYIDGIDIRHEKAQKSNTTVKK